MTDQRLYQTNWRTDAQGDSPPYPRQPCIEAEFLDCVINTDLIAMLPQLNTLSAENLLGLCEALVSQLRYTKEVA